ncbi:uncharacterized protein LOC122638810 [Telopea speciosissima]|uniref:uncharacterized protein LOC122638810 n=1 Tax=Telopea speciosissima TaxID=54955 RepID=UPI001CC69A0E|nr:uncharacterized protein LOC122638810 [Telopea speciosissima]
MEHNVEGMERCTPGVDNREMVAHSTVFTRLQNDLRTLGNQAGVQRDGVNRESLPEAVLEEGCTRSHPTSMERAEPWLVLAQDHGVCIEGSTSKVGEKEGVGLLQTECVEGELCTVLDQGVEDSHELGLLQRPPCAQFRGCAGAPKDDTWLEVGPPIEGDRQTTLQALRAFGCSLQRRVNGVSRFLSNKPTVRRLKPLVKEYKLDLVAIAEPKISFDNASQVMRSLNMQQCVNNGPEGANRLWIFWKEHVKVEVVGIQAHFVSLACETTGSSGRFGLTMVHAPCSLEDRRLVWEALGNALVSVDYPWAVCGDFNAVLDPQEKLGGGPPCGASMEDFGSFVSRVQHLNRTCSDHAPICVELSTTQTRFYAPFRFQQMWIHHLSFRDFVADCWRASFVGTPLSVLFLKLKFLRGRLEEWNRECFSNIHQNVHGAEDTVSRAEFDFESDPTEQAQNALQGTRNNLNLTLLQEEIFWKEKSRVKWLKEGERNTKFFHAVVNVKCKRSGIGKIKNGQGEWIQDWEVVKAKAIRFFRDSFASGQTTNNEEMLSAIPVIISAEENMMLTASPHFEEVKEAVFALSKDSAPGPDGFTGHFFTACWDIVGADVWVAVRDFFEGGFVPRSFTSSHLTLIPKKGVPETMADFRPISLCNFSYKIIAKVLASRLAVLLLHVISKE